MTSVVRDAVVYIRFAGFDLGYDVDTMGCDLRWLTLHTEEGWQARQTALLFLYRQLSREDSQPCLMETPAPQGSFMVTKVF